MNKEFIPYEQALELKELGFDEKCMGYYWEGLFYYETTHSHPSTMPNSIESCLAPLYQQAFRWFKEKYGLYYESYEEAELDCLKTLIKIIKLSK